MSTIVKILTEEFNTLSNDIVKRIELSGQAASGKTQSSFEVNVNPFGGQLIGPAYIGVLQRGRKPGGVPKDFIEILKRWAAAKSITFQDEEAFEIWANAVKWKMIREGSKLYRSGQSEDIFYTPFNDFDRRLYPRIADYYQIELTNQIFSK